jgi:hypothetical protein
MFRRKSISDTDAVFIGWQPSPWGGTFPLYNITRAGHPAHGSTVSDRELRGMNLRLPETPPPPAGERESGPHDFESTHH